MSDYREMREQAEKAAAEEARIREQEREAENARLARTMPCSVCSGGI